MVQRPWPIWTTRRVGADLLGRLVAQSHSLVCEWSLRLRWRLTVAGLDAADYADGVAALGMGPPSHRRHRPPGRSSSMPLRLPMRTQNIRRSVLMPRASGMRGIVRRSRSPVSASSRP